MTDTTTGTTTTATTRAPDRAPPHNQAAEAALLGAMLLTRQHRIERNDRPTIQYRLTVSAEDIASKEDNASTDD